MRSRKAPLSSSRKIQRVFLRSTFWLYIRTRGKTGTLLLSHFSFTLPHHETFYPKALAAFNFKPMCVQQISYSELFVNTDNITTASLFAL